MAAMLTNGQKRNLSCRKEIKLALDTKVRWQTASNLFEMEKLGVCFLSKALDLH
jgi:hypothetical protein